MFMLALLAQQVFGFLFSFYMVRFSACLQMLSADAAPPCAVTGKGSCVPVARAADPCNASQSRLWSSEAEIGWRWPMLVLRSVLLTDHPQFARFIAPAWDGRRCLPRSTKWMLVYFYFLFSEPGKASVYSGPTLLNFWVKQPTSKSNQQQQLQKQQNFVF